MTVAVDPEDHAEADVKEGVKRSSREFISSHATIESLPSHRGHGSYGAPKFGDGHET